MLTAVERVRLQQAIPSTFSVEFPISGETREMEIEPDMLWAGADDTRDEYPLILLEWESRGADVDVEETVNDWSGREYITDYDGDDVDDTEVFIEDYEHRQEDELQVTPVVETTWKDGIPPQARGEAIARQIWRWFRFRAAEVLNEPGPNGERPMTVHLSSTPTPSRVGDTYRLPMAVLLRHTEQQERVVPVAEVDDVELE